MTVEEWKFNEFRSLCIMNQRLRLDVIRAFHGNTIVNSNILTYL